MKWVAERYLDRTRFIHNTGEIVCSSLLLLLSLSLSLSLSLFKAD